MKKLLLTVVAFMAVVAHGKSVDVAEWTEEVRLNDGTTVQVWRRARAYSSGFPNSKRGHDLDMELRYDPLKLQWKGTMSETFVRQPISFEVFDGIAYLVLYIGDKASCSSRERSDYSAQFLKWTNGHWLEIKQTEFPVERALMNLYASYWGQTARSDAKGIVTWVQKSEVDRFRPDKPDTVKSYFERGRRYCSRFVN